MPAWPKKCAYKYSIRNVTFEISKQRDDEDKQKIEQKKREENLIFLEIRARIFYTYSHKIHFIAVDNFGREALEWMYEIFYSAWWKQNIIPIHSSVSEHQNLPRVTRSKLSWHCFVAFCELRRAEQKTYDIKRKKTIMIKNELLKKGRSPKLLSVLLFGLTAGRL